MNITLDARALAAEAALMRTVQGQTSTSKLADTRLLRITTVDQAIELALADSMELCSTIPATVTEPGEAFLRTNRIFDVFQQLPAGPVTLSLMDNAWGVISSGSYTAHIPGEPVSSYQIKPTTGLSFTLPADDFQKLVSVHYTAGEWSGSVGEIVYVEGKQGILTAVATNGHVLAKATIESVLTGTWTWPKRACATAMRMIPRHITDVTIVSGEKSFDVVAGYRRLSSIYAGEKTIPYERVWPTHTTWQATISQDAWLSHLDQVFADVTDDLWIGVQLKPGLMTLKTRTQTSTQFPVLTTTDLEFGINGRYLRDAIRRIPTSDVVVEGTTPDRPVVLSGLGQQAAQHLIMPMRV